jgi:hypothetical protein
MNGHNMLRVSTITLLTTAFFTAYAGAEIKYDLCAMDTEIKIGNKQESLIPSGKVFHLSNSCGLSSDIPYGCRPRNHSSGFAKPLADFECYPLFRRAIINVLAYVDSNIVSISEGQAGTPFFVGAR